MNLRLTGRLPSRRQIRLQHLDVDEHLAFIVRCPARVDQAVALDRFERFACPAIGDFIGGLHVVMSVDQNRRRAFARAQPIRVDHRMPLGRDNFDVVRADALEFRRDPLRCLCTSPLCAGSVLTLGIRIRSYNCCRNSPAWSCAYSSGVVIISLLSSFFSYLASWLWFILSSPVPQGSRSPYQCRDGTSQPRNARRARARRRYSARSPSGSKAEPSSVLKSPTTGMLPPSRAKIGAAPQPRS